MQRDFRPPPCRRNGQQYGSRIEQAVEFFLHMSERRVVDAIRCVDDRDFRWRRRVARVYQRFTAVITHVKQSTADGEMNPNAARCVTAATGGGTNAKHFGNSTERQRDFLYVSREHAAHDVARIYRRIAQRLAELRTPGMIAVAM